MTNPHPGRLLMTLGLSLLLALGTACGSGPSSPDAAAGGSPAAGPPPPPGPPTAAQPVEDLLPPLPGPPPAGAGSRRTRLNEAAARAGLAGDARTWRVALALPEDRRVVLRLDRSERQLATRVWHGRVEGHEPSSASLAVNSGGLAGTVQIGDDVFLIQGLAEGVYEVRRNPLEQPENRCGGVVEASHAAAGAEAKGPSAESDAGPVVDILVAYTQAARGSRTGAQMEALVAQGVADWNTVLLLNSVAQKPVLRLVHAVEVVYAQHASNMGTDLDRLKISNDGFMDEVHALRSQHGADLVHLLLPDGTPIPDLPGFVVAGIALYPSAANQFHAGSGFGVTALPYMSAPSYTMVHELGHNFGANHGNSASEFGFPSYNRGYFLSGTAGSGTYGTVMTYAGSKRPFFSLTERVDPGPSDPPLGQALGGAPGSSYEAHAARGISENAFRVAGYVTQVGPVPNLPGTPTGQAASANRVDLQWGDASSDESGFRVERRATGGGFAQIGQVGAGVTTFSDTTAAASTTYLYRVSAFSNAGSSGYSATVQVTTPESAQASGNLPVAQGWNLVSFPVSEVTAVAPGSGLTTTAYAWDAAAGGYQAVNLGSPASLNSGEGTARGFWVFSSAAASLGYTGWTNTGEHAKPDTVLRQGWNLVGLPYASPVPLSSVQVSTPSGSPQGLTQSVSSTLPRPNPSILLFGLAFPYEPSGYSPLDLSVPGNSLPVNQGMWVYAHEDGVRLIYAP